MNKDRFFKSIRKCANDLYNPFPYRRYTDKRKCIFIHVPKAAGTSIISWLADGKIDRDHATYYDYLYADPLKFAHYFKFCVVRNPWDRLVSAYYYLQLRENSRPDIVDYLGSFDSFESFALRGLGSNLFFANPIFRPQTSFFCDLAGNCQVDFIAKFESLKEDMAVVADRLGISGSLPILNEGKPVDFRREYRSRDSVQKVAELYCQDVQILGYKPPEPAA